MPKSSIAGSALVAVVAIMTFLASLITGAVMLVIGSTAEWQSEVTRKPPTVKSQKTAQSRH